MATSKGPIKTTGKGGAGGSNTTSNICAAASSCANPNPLLAPTDLRKDLFHKPGERFCSYCIKKGIHKKHNLINGSQKTPENPTFSDDVEESPWGTETDPRDILEAERKSLIEKNMALKPLRKEEKEAEEYNFTFNPYPVEDEPKKEVSKVIPLRPSQQPKPILKDEPLEDPVIVLHPKPPIKPKTEISEDIQKKEFAAQPRKIEPLKSPYFKKPTLLKSAVSRVSAATGEVINGSLGIGASVISLGSALGVSIAGTTLLAYGAALRLTAFGAQGFPLKAVRSLARVVLGRLGQESTAMGIKLFKNVLPKTLAGIIKDGRIVPLTGLGLAGSGIVLSGVAGYGAIGSGLMVGGVGAFLALPAYGFARGLITGDVRSPVPKTNSAQVPGAEYTTLQKAQSFIAKVFGSDVKSQLHGVLKTAYRNPKWVKTVGMDPKAVHELNNEFERVTADALKALGLKDVRVNGTQAAKENGHVDANGKKRAGDGGFDVIGRDGEGRVVVVSCKRYAGLVGVDEVRQIFATGRDGNISRFRNSRQILVTTNGFTKEAKIFAKGNGVILTTLDEIIEEAAKKI